MNKITDTCGTIKLQYNFLGRKPCFQNKIFVGDNRCDQKD